MIGRIYARDDEGREVAFGKGKPWIQFSLTIGGKTKRVRRRIDARTKTEAELALAAAVADAYREAGERPPELGRSIDLEGAAQTWADATRKGRRDLDAVLRFAAWFGDRWDVDAVTTRDGQAWARDRARDVSGPTVCRELTALSSFFTWAKRRELCRLNPIRDVDRPDGTWTPPEPLTRDEVAALLKAAKGKPLEPVIVLAYWAGLRRGEIVKITRDHILGDSLHVPGTKTKRSKGTIPILPGLAAYLERHTWNGPYLVAQANGQPYQPQGLHAMVQRWNRAAKRKRRGPPLCPNLHRLRHSIGAHLIADGHPPHVVAAFLRDSEKMVETVYGHYTATTFADRLSTFRL